MTPLTLPSCLLQAAKLLFPTLDFGRLRFYYDKTTSANATDRTISYLTQTHIIFIGQTDEWPKDYCHPETFLLLCHELVHALQAQNLLRRIIHRAASWTCRFLHGADSSANQNCVEHEAYEYEERLKQWMTVNAVRPCLCHAGPMFVLGDLAIESPGFAAAVGRDPSIIKRDAGCAPWDCIGSGLWDVILGSMLTVASLIWAVPIAFIEGTAGYIGAIVGAVVSTSAGAVVGFQTVGVIGLLFGGLVGLIVGGIAGALIGNIIHWLDRLFGDDGGALNLMFSSDQGLTFNSKASFERSRQPMSLSFGLRATGNKKTDRLAVAFTGTDNRVNLLTLPYDMPWNSKSAFQESEDCGPAVTHNGVRMQVVWQGTDHRINSVHTHDGHALQFHQVLDPKTPGEASPAICVVAGKSILALIDDKLRVCFRVSIAPHNWKHTITFNDRADSETTVAITRTRANDFAIAWVGAEKRKRINILNLTFDPNTNAIIPGQKFLLGDRSEAGPALAFSEPFLYLAWTGFDGRVNFMRSRDLGRTFEIRQAFEKSRGDCGPALTVHDETGLIGIGWTGTS